MLQLNSSSIPPPPSPRDLEPFFQLLALIADPKGTQARLDQLAAASLAAQTLIDEAAQAKKDIGAERAAHDQAISQERAAHDAQLARQRAASLSESDARERALIQREADVKALEVLAKSDADAAAKMKADLERRLKTINAAAAG